MFRSETPYSVFANISFKEAKVWSEKNLNETTVQYRTINAECNNVKNPTWGITGAAYLRVLQPMYEDGKFMYFVSC